MGRTRLPRAYVGLALLLACVAAGCSIADKRSGGEGPVVLSEGALEIRIDPSTLAVEARLGARALTVSRPAFAAQEYRTDLRARRIVYPAAGLSVEYSIGSGWFSLRLESAGARALRFPIVPIPAAGGMLILPKGEGSYIPADDPGWAAYLCSEERDTLEGLTMPFWGVETGSAQDRSTVTYMLDNPFSNTLRFTSDSSGLVLTLEHDFPSVPAWREPLTVSVSFEANASPIAPALQFRKRLEETHFIRTLEQKIAEVPRTRALIGAIHAYVWSSGPLTAWDAEAGAWTELARRILAGSGGSPDSAGARIKASLTEADWKVIADAAGEQYSYPYLRREMARVLSLVESREAGLLSASYGDLLSPSEEWGGGISRRLIDEIRAAGISRILLTADGWEQVGERPGVAAYAEAQGYLFGTYDSFDSIHDPTLAGPDQSWPTAQFGQALYDTGRILDAAGKARAGFRRLGFKLSPIAARPYVEQRVRDNFLRVPYFYYFVDADAFGDWYDDYTPGRMASARDDARARTDRLEWIASTFKVPVGSEGGAYLATAAITVAEGIFVPVIGFGDADMSDKGSPWYVGGYYPPDGPDVFLKSVPLKEEYLHLFIDPRYRLPLYEAVYHDSVITSAHWSASDLKFSNARQTVALTGALYQAAPLFHLNPDSLAAQLAWIQAAARMFSWAHTYSYRYAMREFRYLTPDRLVQESVFGDLHLVANFRGSPFDWEGTQVPERSVLGRRGDESIVYTP